MKLILKLFLKVLLGFVLLIGGGVLCLLYWRYMPVSLHVRTLEKVVEQNSTAVDKADCGRFKMTPAEFENHFARAHHIFDIEVHDYSWGKCYYKTTINGLEYRVWELGLAQIINARDIDYYAISELKDVYE